MKTIRILKTGLVFAMALALLLLFFSACGKDNAPASSAASSAPSEVLTELEQSIAQHQALLDTEPSTENYVALAELYRQAGQIKQQRDTLERCYRLFADEQSFALLQDITVNAAEEADTVQEPLRQLVQNITTQEYNNEAIAMLMSPDWVSVMMPKLREGHRRYYLEDASAGTMLVAEVGYSADRPYTRAWYATEGGTQVVSLLQQGTTAQWLQTGLANGQYSGAFSLWLCLGRQGAVYKDTGTFENGLLTGAYTTSVHQGDAPMDLFALISTRDELETTLYTGSFGSDGLPTVPQPENAQANLVAYAYTEDSKSYVWLTLPEGEDAAAHVFDAAFYGLPPYPAFAAYTPVPPKPPQGEVTVDLATVQVRVVDGELEWFDGARWHPFGSVADYMAQDPFLGHTPPDPGAAVDPFAEEPEPGGEEQALLGRGAAQAAPASSSSSGASGGTRSSSSQAAATAPAATPAPTTPDPAPAPAPAPTTPTTPTAPTPPAPETGKDGEDIGWTGDHL